MHTPSLGMEASCWQQPSVTYLPSSQRPVPASTTFHLATPVGSLFCGVVRASVVDSVPSKILLLLLLPRCLRLLLALLRTSSTVWAPTA